MASSVGPSVRLSVDVSKLSQSHLHPSSRLQRMRRMRQLLCGRAKSRPEDTSGFRPPTSGCGWWAVRMRALFCASSALRGGHRPRPGGGRAPGGRLPRYLARAFATVRGQGSMAASEPVTTAWRRVGAPGANHSAKTGRSSCLGYPELGFVERLKDISIVSYQI